MCSDHEDVPIVMHNQDQLKADLVDHWLKKMWPPSTTDWEPLDYFMWCEFEREVNICPHINLASLKAMTSDVIARTLYINCLILPRFSIKNVNEMTFLPVFMVSGITTSLETQSESPLEFEHTVLLCVSIAISYVLALFF